MSAVCSCADDGPGPSATGAVLHRRTAASTHGGLSMHGGFCRRPVLGRLLPPRRQARSQRPAQSTAVSPQPAAVQAHLAAVPPRPERPDSHHGGPITAVPSVKRPVTAVPHAPHSDHLTAAPAEPAAAGARAARSARPSPSRPTAVPGSLPAVPVSAGGWTYGKMGCICPPTILPDGFSWLSTSTRCARRARRTATR